MQELQDLEVMKKAMGEVNKEDMVTAVENFVLSIFAGCDKDDRTCEKIGKVQAVAWRRAGHFIDVLTVFGALAPEWEQRRKFAIYKAGTILKCLKSGEEPPRGNPFEKEEEKVPEQDPQEDVQAPTNMMASMTLQQDPSLINSTASGQW